MDPSLLLYDDTYDTLPYSAYATPIIFKRSELAHDDVPRYYFPRFVETSGWGT